MLEYARIFAYWTDMNLIGRDGRTDGRTDNPASRVAGGNFITHPSQSTLV
jgi:hypothetical protein